MVEGIRGRTSFVLVVVTIILLRIYIIYHFLVPLVSSTMVRVISQNFSPPRSRHSSGETDWDLAERADSALSALVGKKRCEIGLHDYESSSDSFWDSEFDFEHLNDGSANVESPKDDINGNEPSGKSFVQTKKKERRRERNKISAQAYRKRKRQINNNKQQELYILEEKNKQLLELVNRLEEKTKKAKMFLRGVPVPTPHTAKKVNIVKSIPESASLSTLFAAGEATGQQKQQLNLNMNKNVLHQPPMIAKSTTAEFHQRVEPVTEGAKAINTSDRPDFLNANINPLTPILINANALVSADSNARTSDFPAHATFRSFVSVKSKHGYHNTNMNYKSPILRPSTLQTVPENSSCFLGDSDDNTMATSLTSGKSNSVSQVDAGVTPCKEEKVSSASMKMAFSNNNINLNNSNFDYANDNFRKRDNNACDNHIQMNSHQLANMNGNLNQNALASTQDVYKRSHHVKDSDYIC